MIVSKECSLLKVTKKSNESCKYFKRPDVPFFEKGRRGTIICNNCKYWPSEE